jgi:metal-sulfur cluster biosynthetic enzyme
MLNKELLIEEVFKKYNDPELEIDIWTLGLVYGIEVKEKDVDIKLTFTSPMCPFGPQMVEEIKSRVKEQGAENVEVEVVFEPRWEPSEELREMLGV